MTPRSKLLAALATGGMLFAAAAFAEAPANNGHHMMGPGGMQGMTEMHQSMTRMIEGCARMMQTAAPEGQGRTDKPAPAPDQTH